LVTSQAVEIKFDIFLCSGDNSGVKGKIELPQQNRETFT